MLGIEYTLQEYGYAAILSCCVKATILQQPTTFEFREWY